MTRPVGSLSYSASEESAGDRTGPYLSTPDFGQRVSRDRKGPYLYTADFGRLVSRKAEKIFAGVGSNRLAVGVKPPRSWGNRHPPAPAIPHHDWASEFR